MSSAAADVATAVLSPSGVASVDVRCLAGEAALVHGAFDAAATLLEGLPTDAHLACGCDMMRHTMTVEALRDHVHTECGPGTVATCVCAC